VISEYVERLARELDFDPSLSRCVRREVEDHLWEAVAADPEGGGLEAERRAVANFGDSHVIAAQFAVVSLAKHAKRVGVVAVVLIAAVFIAMKARLAWYAVMECPAGEMGDSATSSCRSTATPSGFLFSWEWRAGCTSTVAAFPQPSLRSFVDS